MLPRVIYAAAYPDPRPDHDGTRFETRMLTDGEVVGVGFSSLAGLVDALGPSQPWIALSLDRFEELMGAAGLGRVLIDPPLPTEALHWTDDELSALVAVRNGESGAAVAPDEDYNDRGYLS